MMCNVLHAVFIGFYKMSEVFNTATVKDRFFSQLALYTKAQVDIIYKGGEDVMTINYL
jgi:hypothetical protein